MSENDQSIPRKTESEIGQMPREVRSAYANAQWAYNEIRQQRERVDAAFHTLEQGYLAMVDADFSEAGLAGHEGELSLKLHESLNGLSELAQVSFRIQVRIMVDATYALGTAFTEFKGRRENEARAAAQAAAAEAKRLADQEEAERAEVARIRSLMEKHPEPAGTASSRA